MQLSQNGIDLIKSFEGCVLHAYKPVSTERYWTIGFGHYGSDVREEQVISQQEAETL
jgi:GH24 family phage-related lysozyme (muramidase)